MKFFTPIFFLLFSFCITAQTRVFEDETYVSFNLKYAKETTTVDNVDWQKEKLFSEFTLKSKKDIKYAISIQNQSSASLLTFKNGKWEVQEKINITGLALRRIANKVIISEFKITDFNNDGSEDLVCWTGTNINRNKWTLIYLNDTDNLKLVKLWNDADETDIWARPVYNPEEATIRTQRDGSANGTSDESIFLLDGLEAIPVSKHTQDRTEETVTDYYYIGNDKWELYQTFQDTTRKVEFKLPKGITFENINWKKEKLTKEFTLQGSTPLKFSLTLISDSEAVLSEFKDNQWIVRDTIGWFEWSDGYNADESFTQSFTITDFNRDGNEDLICWNKTNANDNELTTIFLNDPKTKALVRLKNNEGDIWASPEYDKLTDIILSNTVSGAYGVFYESTYLLNDMQATPLIKKEYDYSLLNKESGLGGLLRTYKGDNNGKWKLVSEEKIKQELMGIN